MSKETKEATIKYRSAIMHKGEINGQPYVEYEYEYIKASTKLTKRYSNAVCMLMGISRCPHHLLEWLQENMTDGGYVGNNEITRKAFISFHKRYAGRDGNGYSDHAVMKAFGQLSETGLLVAISKGVYQLNPMFFWNDKSEEDRIRSIKYMMEFKCGVETKITIEVNKR